MVTPAPTPFGSEFLVNTQTTGDQGANAVAMLANGKFVVVWEDNGPTATESGYGVRAQLFNADGSKAGAPLFVNQQTVDFQRHPVVAGLTDGRFVVAWEDNSPNVVGSGETLITDIKERIYNPDGSSFNGGGEYRVNTQVAENQTDPAIAALAGGGFVISWTKALSELRIRAREFDANGFAPTEFAASGPSGIDQQSTVVGLSDGSYVIAWQDSEAKTPDFSGSHIAATVFRNNGTVVTNEFTVNDPVISGNQTEPSMARLSDGSFEVSWTTPGAGLDIHYRAINSSGAPATNEFQLGTTSASDETQSSLAALPNDQFVLAWSEAGPESTPGTDASGSHISGTVYGKDPNAFAGPEFVINTSANGNQVTPTVTTLADGRFVVIWTDTGFTAGSGDTSGSAVRGQIFDPRTAAVSLTGTTIGDDWVGTAFGDTMSGLGDNDTLDGRAGNDLLIGGVGADTVIGGAGNDLAGFSAARAQYDVRSFVFPGGSGLWTQVTHVGGADGTDLTAGVERLGFSDLVTEFAGAQLNRASSIDGDRFDDVLIQNGATGQVYYARMIAGAFQSFGTATGALGADWKAIASGDVNPSAAGGGAETFVQQQSTGTIYYASSDTGTIAWGVVSTNLTADWKLRAVGDVNGDACTDAIIQNQTSGTIYYANMAGGVFQGWGVVNQFLTSDWIASGVGDVNRDGFADVVVQQQSTGTTYYANMANGTFAGWGVVSTNLTANWKVQAVADVTGDGFAEVIFQNSVGGGGINPGTTYYADLRTGTVQYGVVTTTVNANWKIEGTADVDNDGFADVVFQNSPGGGGINPGTTYYANMGPGGFEGWGAVATNITADWHVV